MKINGQGLWKSLDGARNLIDEHIMPGSHRSSVIVHRYACTVFCFYDLAADFRLFLIVCPTFFASALQAAAIRYSCMMVKSYITATPMDAAQQLES